MLAAAISYFRTSIGGIIIKPTHEISSAIFIGRWGFGAGFGLIFAVVFTVEAR